MTSQRSLQDIRNKFVYLMRTDPPEQLDPLPREPLAPVFDRWVARRFTADEVNTLFRVEVECGEQVLSEWFGEVLAAAGLADTWASASSRAAS